jgi:surfeit locus 1 family protein
MNHRSTALIGWILAVAVMAGFAALGAWQLRRMHDKQAMLDDAHRVLERREAQSLSAAGDAARSRAYDWAAGEGVFADVPAVLLDNQQHAGRSGVRAYRVFVPASGGAGPLLVELGWLPLRGDRRMPQVPRPQGRLRIEGLLAPPPAHGIAPAPPVKRPDGTLLATSLQVPIMRSALGQPRLAPRVLRLDPANAIGHARDLDILPNTLPPERHLGYAVQWFALALAVLITAFVLTFRKRRR